MDYDNYYFFVTYNYSKDHFGIFFYSYRLYIEYEKQREKENRHLIMNDLVCLKPYSFDSQAKAVLRTVIIIHNQI